ncbi:hypothetical protein BJ508DRAFT_301881 [Ascobolus immersus RN42]|uniref:Uncharacterized protein n=1 Tax=Ascobolus immersus RN42 TaxID=1160509 RepID=A0A3N4IP57_ASCIM|nr:hypothetical protein BJ508DRAFT_301881 [Ascobolus immersus RN42]
MTSERKMAAESLLNSPPLPAVPRMDLDGWYLYLIFEASSATLDGKVLWDQNTKINVFTTRPHTKYIYNNGLLQSPRDMVDRFAELSAEARSLWEAYVLELQGTEDMARRLVVVDFVDVVSESKFILRIMSAPMHVEKSQAEGDYDYDDEEDYGMDY